MNDAYEPCEAVWMRLPPAVDEDELAPLRALLLDEEEQAAYNRYRLLRSCVEYLAGRLLVKNRLARLLGTTPGGIRLIKKAGGKPCTAAEPESAKRLGLYFNLTHAEGVAACAFGRVDALGIDVARCGTEHLALTDQLFLPDESVYIRKARDERESADRFGMLWSRKEAAMKARGTGLALAPLDCPVPVGTGIAEDGHYRWHTEQVGDGHWLTVAVGRAEDRDSIVRLSETTWAAEVRFLKSFE
ncbi:4'-phosphopantetheinyl transferase superfamily protein [Cohnella sp. GbtcB17]|uniref:4'-phosphopantetheinyl transferase family protein n=1 Tax=Cohnella sp. GbtcB17 TaxID=2824762 RepID=UPI001C2F3E56|nr:4'-phosphopantetheinyl transferase superfamily protein [Cohnella sp. GbtcB17]